MTIFYSLCRNLAPEDAVQVRVIAEEVRNIGLPLVNHMYDYVAKTHISARPPTFNSEPTKFPDINEMNRIFTTPLDYVHPWADRVPLEMQEKCLNGREVEVPVHYHILKRTLQPRDNRWCAAGTITCSATFRSSRKTVRASPSKTSSSTSQAAGTRSLTR